MTKIFQIKQSIIEIFCMYSFQELYCSDLSIGIQVFIILVTKYLVKTGNEKCILDFVTEELKIEFHQSNSKAKLFNIVFIDYSMLFSYGCKY